MIPFVYLFICLNMYSKCLKEYPSISDYTSSEQEMGSGSPTCKTYIFYSRSSCGNGAGFTLLQNNDHPLPLQKKICSLCKGMCVCVFQPPGVMKSRTLMPSGSKVRSQHLSLIIRLSKPA